MSTPNDSASLQHQQPSPTEDSDTSCPDLRSPEAQLGSGSDKRADTKSEADPLSLSPASRPIAVTPSAPPSDDDDFIPRGKTTQTLVGGGKKGGRPH